jgi:hypothetical protein
MPPRSKTTLIASGLDGDGSTAGNVIGLISRPAAISEMPAIFPGDKGRFHIPA